VHKGKKFQTKDAAKWDETADWLHKNANAYQDVLRKLMRGAAWWLELASNRVYCTT
jgi:hypothetical protein